MVYSGISVPPKVIDLGTAGTAGKLADRRAVTSVEALLIWTYQTQRADVNALKAGRAAAGPAPVSTNAGAMMRRGQLGEKIDCAGSAAMDTGRCHADAEIVHDAVMRLTPLQTGLLVTHGRTGTRPELPDAGEALWLMPQRRSNGRVMVEDHPQTGAKYCPVWPSMDPAHAAFMVKVAADWLDGLDRLRVMVMSDLTDWRVGGLTASPYAMPV